MNNRLLYTCISALISIIGVNTINQKIVNLDTTSFIDLLIISTVLGMIIILFCIGVNKLNNRNSTDDLDKYVNT